MNSRLPGRILDLIYLLEAGVGASHMFVGVGGRQSDDVIGEEYLVR